MKFEEAVYEFIIKAVLKIPYASRLGDMGMHLDLDEFEKELFVNEA